MEHKDKIIWMALWAAQNSCTLELNGEVGFGRECVGITLGDSYPDYQWYDEKYNPLNGEVWVPEGAYHKHECVAILGRGEEAEATLYEWLKWFDDNGYKPVQSANDNVSSLSTIELLMGRAFVQRMVKSETKDQ